MGCNSLSEHGKELYFDQNRVWCFWILFLGDGANIYRIPLLNKLVSVKNHPVVVLELFDCQGQLVDGGKKDRTFICNIFLDHIRKIYPHKSITTVFIFDGSSNG